MIKKEALREGHQLPIMEDFYTIQGEGFHTGLASYFIRIGGCDVGCHWCDVKESWDESLHPLKDVDDLVKRASTRAKNIIITGGEPLMWNLDYLTAQLKTHKCYTHIETSGAYPLSGTWDWICLSPKKRGLPLKEIYEEAHELKIIVHNQDDFRFAQEQSQKVQPHCKLYLQAEWGKRDEMTPRIVDFILQNPQWKSSLQAHKYMRIP